MQTSPQPALRSSLKQFQMPGAWECLILSTFIEARSRGAHLEPQGWAVGRHVEPCIMLASRFSQRETLHGKLRCGGTEEDSCYGSLAFTCICVNVYLYSHAQFSLMHTHICTHACIHVQLPRRLQGTSAQL